jgi:hypothetical protein
MKNLKIFSLNIVLLFLLFSNSLQSSIENIFNQDYQEYLSIKNFNRHLQSSCNLENCPALQGYCRSDKCLCLEGYITISDGNNFKFCNYKQKESIISLLLESFGLFGVGHLYAGRIYYGLSKIFCFFIFICLGSQFVITLLKEESDTQIAYYVKLLISLGCLGVPIAWHLVDLYKWANNMYKDGNDQPMMNW